MRRVVITGAGALTPIGNDLDSFWQGLSTGKSGSGPITHFDTTGFDTTFACELKDFDATQYLKKIEAKRMDAFCRYGMVATMMAMEHSGLNLEQVDRDRFGVIIASGIGGMPATENAHEKLRSSGPGRIPPMYIPMMIPDILAGQVSIRWGLRGPNFGTVSACASSSHAIGCAVMSIRAGQADLMVAGGAEASICPLGVGGFNSLKAMSTNNENYATASRPFDRDRDGFVMGEGAGIIILEELEHARERGANILGEVVGLGFTADAFHLTAPAPEGEGAQRAMRVALKEAGLQPEDVQHVNTHGTSTPVGDMNELQALRAVFGDHADKLLINSTKSMTGHLLGAAGAVEAIATLLSLRNNLVPPTINLDHLDPEAATPVVAREAVEAELEVGITNAFGFGGHNASLVLRKTIV